MLCQCPVYDGVGCNAWIDASDVLCKRDARPHELQVGQEGECPEQFLGVRSYEHGDVLEDLYYLAFLLSFQFAYAVVGLNHFLWFYKYGLARGALVMHDTAQALFQRGTYGYY